MAEPTTPDIDWNALIAAAGAAAERAYAPYSGFAVGCAVRLANGSVETGVNVENASYGLTMCAERSALGSVIAGHAEGDRDVAAVVIIGPEGEDCSPCGACRQWLLEHAPDAAVSFPYGGEMVITTPAELIPHGFTFDR